MRLAGAIQHIGARAIIIIPTAPNSNPHPEAPRSCAASKDDPASCVAILRGPREERGHLRMRWYSAVSQLQARLVVLAASADRFQVPVGVGRAKLRKEHYSVPIVVRHLELEERAPATGALER